jgi:hypothetical protein
VGRGKDPFAGALPSPVPLTNPRACLCRMPRAAPALEFLIEQRIQPHERGRTDLRRLVGAPSTEPWIQGLDDRCLGRGAMRINQSCQCAIVASDSRLGRRNPGGEAALRPVFAYPLLADMHPQKVEACPPVDALERMGQPRFLGVQREADGGQPGLHSLLAVFDSLAALGQEAEIIRIADHLDTARGKSLVDDLLKAMQRDIGEQRGEHGPLTYPLFRGKKGGLFHDPCLEPTRDDPLYTRTRVEFP